MEQGVKAAEQGEGALEELPDELNEADEVADDLSDVDGEGIDETGNEAAEDVQLADNAPQIGAPDDQSAAVAGVYLC